jgi:hypothetical protein
MSYFQMHKTMYCYYNNKTNFPVICSNIPIKDIKLQWEMCSKSSFNKMTCWLKQVYLIMQIHTKYISLQVLDHPTHSQSKVAHCCSLQAEQWYWDELVSPHHDVGESQLISQSCQISYLHAHYYVLLQDLKSVIHVTVLLIMRKEEQRCTIKIYFS